MTAEEIAAAAEKEAAEREAHEKHMLSLAAITISGALRTLDNICQLHEVAAEEAAECLFQALHDRRDVDADCLKKLITGGYAPEVQELAEGEETATKTAPAS